MKKPAPWEVPRTKWDAQESDPVKDIQNCFEQLKNQPYKPIEYLVPDYIVCDLCRKAKRFPVGRKIEDLPSRILSSGEMMLLIDIAFKIERKQNGQSDKD